MTALTPIFIFPSEWQKWIVENKMQNLSDDRIVRILVSNGFSEDHSREEVQRIRDTDVSFQVGSWNTQRLKKLESVLNTLHAMASLSPTYGVVPHKGKLSRQD